MALRYADESLASHALTVCYFIEQKGSCSLASTIRRRTFSSLDNQ